MTTTRVDVPVVVDSAGRRSAFPMTRCNYFSVECDLPKPGWELSLGVASFPFLMLELVGIIQRPFGAPRFHSAGLFEDLFRRIEEDAGLLVDINDIWLPDFLFTSRKFPQESGFVYRLETQLFLNAFLFREGRLSTESFTAICSDLHGGIALSEEETAAFKSWHQRQLDNAKKQYPKNSNLALSWMEPPQR